MKRTSRWSAILTAWPDWIDLKAVVTFVLIGVIIGICLRSMF